MLSCSSNDKEHRMKANMTQMDAAKQGIVTPEMAAVAASEYLAPEFIRDGVAAGTIVTSSRRFTWPRRWPRRLRPWPAGLSIRAR